MKSRFAQFISVALSTMLTMPLMADTLKKAALDQLIQDYNSTEVPNSFEVTSVLLTSTS
jgi:hypothetical protein